MYTRTFMKFFGVKIEINFMILSFHFESFFKFKFQMFLLTQKMSSFVFKTRLTNFQLTVLFHIIYTRDLISFAVFDVSITIITRTHNQDYESIRSLAFYSTFNYVRDKRSESTTSPPENWNDLIGWWVCERKLSFRF
jgi:hypothetical protein